MIQQRLIIEILYKDRVEVNSSIKYQNISDRCISIQNRITLFLEFISHLSKSTFQIITDILTDIVLSLHIIQVDLVESIETSHNSR